MEGGAAATVTGQRGAAASSEELVGGVRIRGGPLLEANCGVDGDGEAR
jgi:hypothetical protein